MPAEPIVPVRAAPRSPIEASTGQRLAARLMWAVAHSLAATLRWRWREHNDRFINGPSEPVIFAIWHNRLALSLFLYRKRVVRRFPGRRMACLVSASRDGGLLARALELFNAIPVRGSSSRRGATAVLELSSLARSGADLAITPDGPRGPRYVVQPGVIATAQVTGLAIIPVSYHLARKVRLKSWDAFQIPIPFTTVTVEIGEPIFVPADATDEGREACRRELEMRLLAITRD